jgi:glutamine cyclotransferase
VVSLNELEFVKGEIFANVWQSDLIVRIDPATGRVTGRIDLSGLLSPSARTAADVLNGIAYDAARDRLFVTGKLWPTLFEIRLVRR